MSKSPDAFRSIGEVSRLVGVAPHVLRYWEAQFTQLSPVKRADGRRYYRPDDVRLVAGLCQVLREDGLSIRGAKRLITSDRGAGLREIGAARLGETPAEDAPPAVRLVRPTPAQRAPAPKTEPARPRPAAKKPRPAPAEPLPLFSGIDRVQPADWLDRLVTAAVRLRAVTPPAPAELGALRDRLSALR